MCGIAGILNKQEPVHPDQIRKMTQSMSHRGPDAEGFFMDNNLAFGHRRLSIIDLSDAANQPFKDVSGRYIIIFNGEIYNFREVKSKLPDYPFQTVSDTEVILAAYIRWGVKCLDYLRGMFTIVIWDKQNRELFIARDRLGVKPLYYHQGNDQFVFASELRAILALGNICRKHSAVAFAEFFRYQSIGFPNSPVKTIRQVEAGTWMLIRNGEIKTEKYWDPTVRHYDFDFTDSHQVRRKVKELMLQSVSRRLVSDVPVGAFLSGGIDSSAVVGLMVEAGDTNPNTFNISFDETEYDESVYANMIAKKFNTRHTQIHMKPEIMLDELTNALDMMDTPSGDGINTYVVSKAIRKQGITVALSGVGGDELFAGYPIFEQYISVQQKSWIWRIPSGMRNLLSAYPGWKGKAGRMRQLVQLKSPSIENVYPIFRQLISPELLRRLTHLDGDNESTLAFQLQSQKNNLSKLPYFSQVTAAEYIGYTQQTLLKDTDQMSMANSLEIREPFFDQDLVEFVMSVPDHFKVPVYPKSLLVESLKPMLPDEIVFRKKKGFLFPWNEWMKTALRSFCETNIDQMSQRQFIHGEELKKFWKRFLSGDAAVRWQELWLFVVLNYWMNKNSVE